MTSSGESLAEDKLAFDRLVFFSDAVFAIVITLLVLEIKVPQVPHERIAELPAVLLGLGYQYVSHVISFVGTGIYWALHHRMFQFIHRFDAGLLWLNLLFLLFVSFIPFPSGLLGEYGDEHGIAILVYDGMLTAVGLAQVALWLYATRGHRLVDPRLDPGLIRDFTVVSVVPLGVNVFSIFISFFSLGWAQLAWWLAPVIWLLYPRCRIALLWYLPGGRAGQPSPSPAGGSTAGER